MVTVFENGQLLQEYSFDEVRERAELPLVKQRKREQQQKQPQNVMIVAVCQSCTTFTYEDRVILHLHSKPYYLVALRKVLEKDWLVVLFLLSLTA